MWVWHNRLFLLCILCGLCFSLQFKRVSSISPASYTNHVVIKTKNDPFMCFCQFYQIIGNTNFFFSGRDLAEFNPWLFGLCEFGLFLAQNGDPSIWGFLVLSLHKSIGSCLIFLLEEWKLSIACCVSYFHYVVIFFIFFFIFFAESFILLPWTILDRLNLDCHRMELWCVRNWSSFWSN